MVKFDQKFKPEYAAAIYLLAIAANLICQLICAGVILSVPEGENREVTEYALSLLLAAANLVVFLVFILAKKTKPQIFLKSEKESVGPFDFCAAGIVFGVVCLFCFMAAASGGQRLLEVAGYKLLPPYNASIPLKNIFLVIVAVVAAPVCEELIYRSALASGLKQKFNDYITAALVGLAFALMHMNPEQTVYQFFLGFGAALLALSLGSVIPAVIMHATSNLIVALAMLNVSVVNRFFDWYDTVFAASDASLALSAALLAAAGMFVFIFGAKLLKRYARQTRRGCKETPILTVDQTAVQAEALQKTRQEEQEERLYSRTTGGNEGFFVKNKTVIVYASGLAVSAFMWIFVFTAGLGGAT